MGVALTSNSGERNLEERGPTTVCAGVANEPDKATFKNWGPKTVGTGVMFLSMEATIRNGGLKTVSVALKA